MAPPRLVPLIVTGRPTPAPPGGETDAIDGVGMMVKVALVATPPGVVTWIGPELAPGGTVVWILVLEETLNAGCGVPLKETLVAPPSPDPSIEIGSPTPDPPAGETAVIVGIGTTVNTALVATPPGVVIWIGPVLAPEGTEVAISFGATSEKTG